MCRLVTSLTHFVDLHSAARRCIFTRLWSLPRSSFLNLSPVPLLSVCGGFDRLFVDRDAFSLRFSSLNEGFGRVSLSTGNSILPRIFGPSNFSALMFSITGASTSASSSSAISASSCSSSSSVASGSTVSFAETFSITGVARGSFFFYRQRFFFRFFLFLF